jgi:hypothetical protein
MVDTSVTHHLQGRKTEFGVAAALASRIHHQRKCLHHTRFLRSTGTQFDHLSHGDMVAVAQIDTDCRALESPLGFRKLVFAR